MKDDITTLARTLYGEARAKDEQDAYAIAHVIMNRVALRNWPGTVAAVCLQPYQFSCWNINDPNRDRILNASGKWFDRCGEIALDVLTCRSTDATARSTHYHTPKVKPNWSKGKTPVYKTRGHMFFNDIDTPPPTTVKPIDSLSSG